ncbi:MAG: penicillin-binding protein 2 [Endomicrobium sp.]|jgi:cell division protein FtsI (penicillin-binding protein 3)|nr:penicillin-binding protein 2 [Endomicrobium sp.]
MGKRKNKVDRKNVLALLTLPVFFLLFAKLAYLQIFLHKKINCVVDKMINRENVEISKRGDILDVRGNILATSIKNYTIFLDAKMIEDFETLKKVFDENGIRIKQKNLCDLKNMSYVPVAFNVDSFTAGKIKKAKLKGVGFETKYTRCYPQGRLLSNILGITGCDDTGLEGVEKICNAELAGETVKTKIIRDGRGHIIRNQLLDTDDICGSNVVLTIDINIQFIVEQEMRKAFEKYKATKAVCIVQDPQTGKILAMVSLPDFDHSDKTKNMKYLRNSAIVDIYEPGSTFKIVTVASALEEGRVKTSDALYLENGRFKIAGHVIKDDHKVEGSVGLSRAFELSSNIGMIKIAQKLGADLFYKYIRKFGFYSLTGIDLPGEAKGILMDVKKWNALTLPNISFGQGIGVSALQVVNAFSAVANGGVLMKPFVIQKIIKHNCEEKVFDKKEIRRVISEDTALIVRKLLKNVIDSGTGKSAKVRGYTTGGKTGTAQKVDPVSKTYSTRYYTASFCGMLPAMNPKFVVLVVIDEPKGCSYYATSVASPVFASISKRIAEYLCIEKDDIN